MIPKSCQAESLGALAWLRLAAATRPRQAKIVAGFRPDREPVVEQYRKPWDPYLSVATYKKSNPSVFDDRGRLSQCLGMNGDLDELRIALVIG